jgi:hypothetical protein
MKHQLAINTPQAGLVVMLPREGSSFIRCIYFGTEDPQAANTAAQYLLMEGFIEYAGGHLDELLETPDWQTQYSELKDAIA